MTLKLLLKQVMELKHAVVSKGHSRKTKKEVKETAKSESNEKEKCTWGEQRDCSQDEE